MAETLLQFAAAIKDPVHQGVVELFVTESPVLGELHFIDIREAMGYEFNAEASLGGVGSRALNEEYAEAAKTSGKSRPIKEGTTIMGGEVLTDRQMLSAQAQRVAQKVRAASAYFTRLFLRGDSSADPKVFDGIYARCTGDRVRYAGDNGGVLNLDVLDRMILAVPGQANQKRLYMGVDMQVRLGSVIRAQGGTRVSLVEWATGATAKSYSGVPIVDPGEDETRTQIMAFNEKRGNSEVTGSIVCARLGGNVDGEYVQGIARLPGGRIFETEDQGIRGTQSHMLVEGRLGLAVHHDRCIQRYGGILNANA